jgi:hypothetical protein
MTEGNAWCCALHDVEASRALNPRLQSFTQWLSAGHTRLPAPVAAGQR